MNRRTAASGVPDHLSQAITTWQTTLARAILEREPAVPPYALTQAVQQTIARLLFLHIRAARDGADEGMRSLLAGPQIAPRLGELFYPHPCSAERVENLAGTIADAPLRRVIAHIAADMANAYAHLSIPTLSRIYEQLPGTSIRTTPDGTIEVDACPDARRAQGQYYTPPPLVDYLVRQTVGPLLAEHSPGQRASRPRLRILDPACGTGAFLLGAYQYLLDWYHDRYLSVGPEQHPDHIEEGADGTWRLTLVERARILETHLYGVDIDPMAVTVTQLLLLLMLLEGQPDLSPHAPAWPKLEAQIKCGHALLGPDFAASPCMRPASMTNPVRPFDWVRQFPAVFAATNPGFDLVLGNPPWGGAIDTHRDYFHARYPASTQDHTDSFKLFIDAGLGLTRRDGILGMIVPGSLLRQHRARDVRTLLLQQQIQVLVDLGDDLFSDVTSPACMFVVRRSPPAADYQVCMLQLAPMPPEQRITALAADQPGKPIRQLAFHANANLEFAAATPPCTAPAVKLGEWPGVRCMDAGINYQRVRVGMQAKGQGDLARRLFYIGPPEHPDDRMYWKGGDIGRYWIAPHTARYCRSNYQSLLLPGEVVYLHQKVFATAPKLLLRQTADRIIATLDTTGVWFGRSLLAIVSTTPSPYQIEYLLGILNSRYIAGCYQELAHERGRVFAQVKLSRLRQLPIRVIDFTNPADIARHDRLVTLVRHMLAMQLQMRTPATLPQPDQLQQEISATDAAIDALVDELYGVHVEAGAPDLAGNLP
ncbi:MAG: Eco57I restriction-modification methylase domain-containing protein [Chloroflexaceae bacterium]